MATKAKTKRSGETVSAGQVIRFLAENPDFFADNADALEAITPPARDLGDGVTDFQQAMIHRLRDKIGKTEDVARVLIDTSRDNMSTQARIHEGVIALLDANSFEQVIQTVTVDLAVLMDLDAVDLCVETADTAALPVGSLRTLPAGAIDELMGAGRSIALSNEISADPAIFGPAASLVQSQALVRLEISAQAPPALIAFGSREPDHFHAGQATELLQFLAQVLEKLIRSWLKLPA